MKHLIFHNFFAKLPSIAAFMVEESFVLNFFNVIFTSLSLLFFLNSMNIILFILYILKIRIDYPLFHFYFLSTSTHRTIANNVAIEWKNVVKARGREENWMKKQLCEINDEIIPLLQQNDIKSMVSSCVSSSGGFVSSSLEFEINKMAIFHCMR